MIRQHLQSESRAGFTLMEMIVASASASVLIAGLASSIFVASRAFDDSDGTITRNLDASFVADEILTDLQLATSYTERSVNAVEIKVPDRDGDGNHETIRYAWSGTTGDPLTKSLNGSTPESIVDGVANLNLEYFTRTLTGVEAPVIFVPGITYEGFEETHLTNDEDDFIILSTPAGIQENELLIAAIAVLGDSTERFKKSVLGWTLAGTEEREETVTLGVWYRIAQSSEPSEHTFFLQEEEKAYGWMMRFSGNDTATPVEGFAMNTATSNRPEAPDANVGSDNSLVLRIGAFDDASISTDDPGVSDHTAITMDQADAVSGGAAFLADVETGDSGKTNFQLKAKENYVTATLVIKPALEASE